MDKHLWYTWKCSQWYLWKLVTAVQTSHIITGCLTIMRNYYNHVSSKDIFFFIEILLKNKTPSPISYMAVSLIDKFSRKIINNIYWFFFNIPISLSILTKIVFYLPTSSSSICLKTSFKSLPSNSSNNLSNFSSHVDNWSKTYSSEVAGILAVGTCPLVCK